MSSPLLPVALPPFTSINKLAEDLGEKTSPNNPSNTCRPGHYLAFRVICIIAIVTNLVATVLSLALAILTSPLLCHKKAAWIPKNFATALRDSAHCTLIFLVVGIFADCGYCAEKLNASLQQGKE